MRLRYIFVCWVLIALYARGNLLIFIAIISFFIGLTSFILGCKIYEISEVKKNVKFNFFFDQSFTKFYELLKFTCLMTWCSKDWLKLNQKIHFNWLSFSDYAFNFIKMK